MSSGTAFAVPEDMADSVNHSLASLRELYIVSDAGLETFMCRLRSPLYVEIMLLSLFQDELMAFFISQRSHQM